MTEYLLSTRVLADVINDHDLFVREWHSSIDLRHQYISVISLGVLKSAIEKAPQETRDNWRHFLGKTQARFDRVGNLVDVSVDVVGKWALLRNVEVAGEILAEEDNLIVATALSRSFILVDEARSSDLELQKRFGLKLFNPYRGT